MHVSQPSLSAQAQALERGLGVELVRRTTRRTEPTEAGRALREDAVEGKAPFEQTCGGCHKPISDEHADVLREAVAWPARRHASASASPWTEPRIRA